jgi:hypothetical protein
VISLVGLVIFLLAYHNVKDSPHSGLQAKMSVFVPQGDRPPHVNTQKQ